MADSVAQESTDMNDKDKRRVEMYRHLKVCLDEFDTYLLNEQKYSILEQYKCLSLFMIVRYALSKVIVELQK